MTATQLLTHTRKRFARRPRPVIEPLGPADEIALRRTLITLAFAAWESADTWAQADHLAHTAITALRAEGLDIVKVRWTR